MKIYSVYLKPGERNRLEHAQFIHEGFHGSAFVFMAFWTLYHRMWLWAIGIILLNALNFYAFHYGHIDYFSMTVIDLGARLMLALNGSDMIGWRLKRRGYVLEDIVTGKNLLEAQQRFFDRRFGETPLALPIPASPWSALPA